MGSKISTNDDEQNLKILSYVLVNKIYKLETIVYKIKNIEIKNPTDEYIISKIILLNNNLTNFINMRMCTNI